jgi:hypothetical protein
MGKSTSSLPSNSKSLTNTPKKQKSNTLLNTFSSSTASLSNSLHQKDHDTLHRGRRKEEVAQLEQFVQLRSKQLDLEIAGLQEKLHKSGKLKINISDPGQENQSIIKENQQQRSLSPLNQQKKKSSTSLAGDSLKRTAAFHELSIHGTGLGSSTTTSAMNNSPKKKRNSPEKPFTESLEIGKLSLLLAKLRLRKFLNYHHNIILI